MNFPLNEKQASAIPRARIDENVEREEQIFPLYGGGCFFTFFQKNWQRNWKYQKKCP